MAKRYIADLMSYRKPPINTLLHGLQNGQRQWATRRIILAFAVLSWLWLAGGAYIVLHVCAHEGGLN